MPFAILALDIGGANLKAAHTRGAVVIQPFELWKYPGELAAALRRLFLSLPDFELLAVTMTGELCDCFPTKRDGVHAILDAVESVAGPASIRVWQTEGWLVDTAAARQAPLRVAAANWLALATFCGRYVPDGPGLVVDVGSTTTDIIPLLDGRPISQGRNDPERLHSRELVYTGGRRTPVCALLGAEGAAELFATSLDVHLVLGHLPEDASDHDTADGRPATRSAALARLARMRCADAETCTEKDVLDLARDLADRQLHWIVNGLRAVLERLPAPPRAVVTAGSGEFLAQAAVRQVSALPPIISLAQELGPAASQAACAHALMVLASES